jgi:hypothetical protein
MKPPFTDPNDRADFTSQFKWFALKLFRPRALPIGTPGSSSAGHMIVSD